jgi:hypothetical protein
MKIPSFWKLHTIFIIKLEKFISKILTHEVLCHKEEIKETLL